MDSRTGTFLSGGARIFYRLFGRAGATPLLIVHGLSYISYDWIGPAAALASDREVVAMDMRGFGESDWAADYTVPTVAGDVVGLLDHLGWAGAVLMGHSMGARGCVYAAAENPGRVAGLVLVDYSPEGAPAGTRRVAEKVADTPERFASVEEAMVWFGAEDADKRARYQAYLKPVDGGVAIKRDVHFRDQFRRYLETGERPKLGADMWAALGKVPAPILAIRGARSDMFAAETMPKMTAANAKLTMMELPTGHDVAGEDPDGLVREVRAFLERVGP